MGMQLITRVNAAQAAVDKFLGSNFKWGENDCAHLCAFAITSLGLPDPLEGMRSYTTALGSKRAMKQKWGVDTIEEVLDALGFERIAPARALPSDILGIPTDEGEIALGLSVGSADRVLIFMGEHDGDVKCRWSSHKFATHAWRVA